MIKKIIQSNSGSTMVEVLVGFTILVMVLVECMVHLVGVSGEMVRKSRDMQQCQAVMTQEMYKKDAPFEQITGADITLTLDNEQTDESNQASHVTIGLDAGVYRFYSAAADLTVFRIIKK